MRRSREGAWIEIILMAQQYADIAVAPARERGLKFLAGIADIATAHVAPARERGLKSCGQCLGCRLDSRSREGAWIEIVSIIADFALSCCRSREGAWIEII